MKPSVVGVAREPSMPTTLPASTVTARLQLSGQSSGHEVSTVLRPQCSRSLASPSPAVYHAGVAVGHPCAAGHARTDAGPLASGPGPARRPAVRAGPGTDRSRPSRRRRAVHLDGEAADDPGGHGLELHAAVVDDEHPGAVASVAATSGVAGPAGEAGPRGRAPVLAGAVGAGRRTGAGR